MAAQGSEPRQSGCIDSADNYSALCKSNVESYEKVLILTEALFLLLSGFRYQTLQCYQTARPGAPTPLFPRVVLTKPRCLNTDLLPQSSGD